MKKKIIALSLATLMLLSACGAPTSKEPAKEGATTAQSPAVSEEVLTAKPTGEKIVVATNNTGDGRDAWLKDKATAAGFNIEVVGLGGGEITARIIAEVSNPTINVAWGPSEDQFTSMLDAKALAPFVPTWKEEVAGAGKENGHSWAYEIQPKFWLANPTTYTVDTAPKTVNDLWEKPEFHGKYAVPVNFSGNTNRAIIASILTQYLDESGDLGVSAEGWAAIKSFFDHGYKTPTGEDDFQNMADGKVPITYVYAAGLKKKMESFNVEPLIIIDEKGQPTNSNQLGVINNKNEAQLEESMRFANWLGSAEIIGAYSQENGNMVANKAASDQMIPMIKDLATKYKAQDIDWSIANPKMDDWVAKIQLEIY